MCGRYVLEDFEELSERLTQVPLRYEFQPRPTWNAAPTQILPVVVEEEGEWVVEGMQWGLIPRWTKPGERPKTAPINARAETLTERPMFRSLIRNRRCLVPASGFYEWQKRGEAKQPYYIRPRDGGLMLFAGLYDEAPGETPDDPRRSYTIITTSANELMAPLHDRMPVVLEQVDYAEWLSREETDPAPLERLLAPYPADELEAYPVSRAVNNIRHNDPSLIEPEDDEAPRAS